LLDFLRVALGRGFPFPAGMPGSPPGICIPGSEGILPEPIAFIIFAI
jgi:hypothetical protein